jgi:phosphoadenosine phosphosulfate reductase
MNPVGFVTIASVTDLLELSRANAGLEGAAAGDVIEWAVAEFGAEQVVCTASFGDATLVHLMATYAPEVEIVLLDTQYLFDETLAYAEDLRRRFDLNLTIARPAANVVPDDLWQLDPDTCCQRRKVAPMERALAGKGAWISGLRRSDSETRANTPMVSWDLKRSITKVNPIAAWTDADVEAYAAMHDLPEHPLTSQGYASIGCWPCTQPVGDGQDARSGRWAGLGKTECGLHL